MNTDCLVIVNGVGFEANDAARRAECVVDGYELAFSRFLAESDLSRLNESPSSEVPVSAALAEIVTRAIGYARLTGGVFDPLVLGDLESIGYDRSFERIGGRATVVRRRPRPAARWTPWDVDTVERVGRRPIGQRVDLGGVAEGAAADAAMREPDSFP